MAGDWLAWVKGLSRKPEVIAVARATGCHRRWVASALMELWEWVDEQTSDGWIPGVTLDDLRDIVPETTGQLWCAVVQVGWLIVENDGLRIPNFDYWLSNSAKKRLQETHRKRNYRSKLPPNGTLSHSERDIVPKKASPEKRREEKSKEEPPLTPPVAFPLTAEGLAQAWVFHSISLRNGRKREVETDLAPEFAELLRLGQDPQALLTEIQRRDRDRGEPFFRYRDRFARPRPAGPSSALDVFDRMMGGRDAQR